MPRRSTIRIIAGAARVAMKAAPGKTEELPGPYFTESLAKVPGVRAAFFYCKDDRLAEIIVQYADLSEAQRHELQIKAAEFAGHWNFTNNLK